MEDISDIKLNLSDAKEIAQIMYGESSEIRDISLISISNKQNNGFMFNVSLTEGDINYEVTSYVVLTGKDAVFIEYYRIANSPVVRINDVVKVFQSIKLTPKSLENYNTYSYYSGGGGSKGKTSGGPWYTDNGSCYHYTYGCSGATIPYPPKNKNYRACSKCCR